MKAEKLRVSEGYIGLDRYINGMVVVPEQTISIVIPVIGLVWLSF